MRRPDLRIRVQLTVSVSLFTLICIVSLAVAIYNLSRSTLLNLQKGNLDLNCRMRRDECRQEIQDTYETYYRLSYSSPVLEFYSATADADQFDAAASLLHDSFGPDRILQLLFYSANGTGLVEIDSKSVNTHDIPSSLLPVANSSPSLNRTLEKIVNNSGLLLGPVDVAGSIAGTKYLLSLSLPIFSDEDYARSPNGLEVKSAIGYATFIFSGAKLERVLSAVSLNSAESEIGSAALCAANKNVTELHQLIPFNDNITILDFNSSQKQEGSSLPGSLLADDSGNLMSASDMVVQIPEKMATTLRDGKLPVAEVDKGPEKSMISIAQFEFLGRTFYVTVLQAHHGVCAMPHALRNSVIISSCCVAFGMILSTFLFVSFGARQILRLKMSATYERPAPFKWRFLPLPWWLRPANSIVPIEKADSESEYQVPEKVPLRKHVRDELDDITDRFNTMSDELSRQYAKLESRVKSRKAEIEQAREAADVANAAKSHFLARVTHELRTPLNGIIGSALLCLEEDNIDNIHKSLRTIFKCGELLLHLMTDLLSFSQNEVENLELEMRELTVPEITSQLTAIFTEQCAAKKIHLTVESDPELDNMVFSGDTNRILQVIFNLMSNGIKFTPEGGHVVSKAMLLPGDSDDTRRLAFLVKDDGPGIAPDMQARVFEAFVQGDISSQVKKAGVGLGLSICRQLAERMHGTIVLHSELNEGSTFTFTVPLRFRMIEHTEKDSPPKSVSESLDNVSPTAGIRSNRNSALNSPKILPDDGNSPSNKQLTSSTSQSAATEANDGSPRTPSPPPSPRNERRRRFGLRSLSSDNIFKSRRTPSNPPPPASARRLDPASEENTPIARAIPTVRKSILPDAHNVPAPPIRPAMTTGKSFAEHPPSHLKILVVDDNSVNQEVMLRMLNLEGLKTIEVANDGLDAVNKVKASISEKNEFDVIFMDVQMPNMDGRQATRVIRTELNSSVPIVAVSAFANEKNADDCLSAGMTLFLSKPLRRPHLRQILRNLADIASDPLHIPGQDEDASAPPLPKLPSFSSNSGAD